MRSRGKKDYVNKLQGLLKLEAGVVIFMTLDITVKLEVLKSFMKPFFFLSKPASKSLKAFLVKKDANCWLFLLCEVQYPDVCHKRERSFLFASFNKTTSLKALIQSHFIISLIKTII